jgi:hypothetical protein
MIDVDLDDSKMIKKEAFSMVFPIIVEDILVPKNNMITAKTIFLLRKIFLLIISSKI